MSEKKKKIGFWTKFTTNDWMNAKQLKTSAFITLIAEVVFCSVIFVMARSLFTIAESAILAVVLYALVAVIVVHQFRKKIRLKTGQ
jgi:positive regulator of sigma E activity